MTKHRNIPIFVTHQGCPHKCAFCDQKTITGKSDTTPESADKYLEKVFSDENNKETEIAFFGGSFTAIEQSRMIKYLEVAKKYRDSGLSNGIRLSTRPDALGDEILEILKEYKVTAIEIGVQSVSEKVLRATKRGHSARDSVEAMKRVKKYGFELTGQMMTGLPESTPEDEIKTAECIAECGCDKARIYPTAVFSGTELERMYRNGSFSPPGVAESVIRAANCAEIFIENKIELLRIGLCSTDIQGDSFPIAGGYHPSIGEMVYSEIYYRIIKKHFENPGFSKAVLEVPQGEISKVIGQNKSMYEKMKKEFGLSYLKIKPASDLKKYEVRVNKCI